MVSVVYKGILTKKMTPKKRRGKKMAEHERKYCAYSKR
jgi:hypothetical protein